jgi:murein DD-endopeptidase MepM/ murein hydrolase activator NlpD
METYEIKIVVWLFVSIFITLSMLGFATRADLQPSSSIEPPPPSLTTAPPQPGGPPPYPKRVAMMAANPIDTSPLGDSPTRPRLAPAEPAPESLSERLPADAKCPLSRVALVRGSDSEASEGGGFYAARRNGIHGAVDLNGSLGESVFAVANGKVVTAGDWGKLGNTVILDHLDGGYTVYGHLDSVDVTLNSAVTTGQMLGTIGYSGNAKTLKAKNLPPHLHFAYLRGLSPFARIRDSADGLGASFARNNGGAEATAVLDPVWAVGFQKCWKETDPRETPRLDRADRRTRLTAPLPPRAGSVAEE